MFNEQYHIQMQGHLPQHCTAFFEALDLTLLQIQSPGTSYYRGVLRPLKIVLGGRINFCLPSLFSRSLTVMDSNCDPLSVFACFSSTVEGSRHLVLAVNVISG